jgi:hypothetical protein
MKQLRGQVADEIVLACVELCIDCHDACLKAIRHCLRKGGRHGDPRHLGLLMDCAEICRINADFLDRGSERQGLLGPLCLEVCERCVHICEAFLGDVTLRQCADICWTCAESCRRLAGSA